MSRAERRRAEREAKRRQAHGPPDSDMTFSTGDRCSRPELFSTEGCCICGHESAAECPCNVPTAIAHLERAHRNIDSTPAREIAGCPIKDSDPAPVIEGIHEGVFQAPCGDGVMYMTPVQFPTMGHYRWHGIYDHLTGGACQEPSKCDQALQTGDV